MCLYLYSPDCYIKIEFISETVSLRTFGSSMIISDFLVCNNSKKPISELVILLPKPFLKIKNRKSGPVLFSTLKHETRTDDFRDEKNPQNITYTISGYEIQRPDYKTINFIIPNPNQLNRPIRFSGEIIDGNQNKLSRFPGLKDTAVILLNSIGYAVFKYKFITELNHDDKRWVRLHFFPPMAAIYHPPWSRMMVLWLINTLKFNYHIMGPFDVRNIFIERLRMHECIIQKKFRENPTEKNQRGLHEQQAAIEQIDNLILEPLIRSKTSFKHFSLHIFPGRLRTLESIYSEGKISPNGVMPNYLKDSNMLPSSASWRRRVYDWTSMELFDHEQDSFNLFFTGHSSNRIYLAILFIVCLWSVISFGILPFLYFIFDIFKLIGAKSYLTKFENLIFLKYKWISFWISILIGFLITPAVNRIKRSWEYFKRKFS